MSPRVRSRVALAATAFAVTTAVAGAPLVGAHDVVVGGDPADGEVLQEFPTSVTLEFSGEPREGFNTFAITEAESGETVHSGEPTVSGRDVSLELPQDLDAGSGDYRLGFQITSSDGHSTRGMTSFSVAGDEEVANDPAVEDSGDAEASEAAEDEGLSTTTQIVLAAVGVLVLLSVVAMAVARQRRNR
jgi:copper resistance protein C